MEPGRRKN